MDLSRLYILDLAGQFGAALEAALARRRVPLARLGDWLVMAAHLALLRSRRRRLPADTKRGEEARREAEELRRRLADREHARRLAGRPERRPQLNRDAFARGTAADGFEAREQAAPQADSVALLRACLTVLEKGHGSGPYRPAPLPLWCVPDALARPRRMLPATLKGAALERFLPEVANDGGPEAALRRNAALASTLLAGLELEREGAACVVAGGRVGEVVVAPTGPAHSAHRGAEAGEEGRPDGRAASGFSGPGPLLSVARTAGF